MSGSGARERIPQLQNTVRQIIADNTAVGADAQTISPQASLWQCGMSSLAGVKVVVEIERAFGVTFADEMLRHATLGSIESLTACVQQLLGRT
jgi:acyl carrier protein